MALGVVALPQSGATRVGLAQQVPVARQHFDAELKNARALFGARRFPESIAAFQQVASLAHQSGDKQVEAKALLGLGGARIYLFEYRQSFDALNRAKRLALEAHNSALAGAADSNLSSLHFQLDDLEAAQQEAEEAVELLDAANRPDYLTRALINYGELESELNRFPAARQAYRRAISIAVKRHDTVSQSLAWDHLGQACLRANQLKEADQALREAYWLRVSGSEPALSITRARMAELALKIGEPARGLRLLDEVLTTPDSSLATIPRYQLIHTRGQMLEALGETGEALDSYRRAVAAAADWRLAALPGDATSISTVSYLHDIYADYVRLAMDTGIASHDRRLMVEALEAVAQNRAASQSEEVTLAFEKQNRIPPRYLELLSELQKTQASVTLLGNAGDQVKLREIRVDLQNVENEMCASAANPSLSRERSREQKSLFDIQKRLGDDDLLLSFFLGERHSYLWAVDRTSVAGYQLAPSSTLLRQAIEFSNLTQGASGDPEPGLALSSNLFGQLPPRYHRKRNWLLVGDGSLLGTVPFSALPDKDPGRHPQSLPAVLAARHTLRFVPSEWSPAPPPVAAASGLFVGVGDPIYNLADSRIQRRERFLYTVTGASRTPALARLVSSDREIHNAALSSQPQRAQFLVGPGVNASQIERVLADRPAVLHFAVHVVSPPGSPEQAALALTLGRNGVSELLTPERIASWRVPGSLIILSGCSSQQGRALPGAGLVGLSRAWLLAGASAVVVSAWPTPDDSGTFFSAFYNHYRQHTPTAASPAQRAARALQLAQLEMHEGTGYRSAPHFWAAYSVVAKE